MSSDTTITFRRYILTRRFQQGRASPVGWAFVIRALGDPDLQNANSWHDLQSQLDRSGAEPAMVDAANIVWRSYLSHVSKARRRTAAEDCGPLQAVGSIPSRTSAGTCATPAD